MSDAFRVLVVDDSVVQRQVICDLLREMEGVEVIGRAADGQEALKMATLLDPDLVTLDLEMPRMDGFTFLRLLMAARPKPVLVISSFGNVDNVFRALEFGAIDFIPRTLGADLSAMRATVREKVSILRASASQPRPWISALLKTGDTHRIKAIRPSLVGLHVGEPKVVFVIAASTGGPPAIVDLVTRIAPAYPHAIVVAQHMPERFTRSFAERLGRKATLRVSEGEDGAPVMANSMIICPGNRSSELVVDGGGIRLRVRPLDPADRYAPSADRLFRSASSLGRRAIGVVLTGMGDDGAAGADALVRAGGSLWVESEETAVIDGMPGAARRVGPSSILPLGALLARVAGHAPGD
jgi:two-component system chemotaxis response regulator CheB